MKTAILHNEMINSAMKRIIQRTDSASNRRRGKKRSKNSRDETIREKKKEMLQLTQIRFSRLKSKFD